MGDDGNLVKKIKPDGSRTIYVGGLYEVDKNSGGTVTKTTVYYPAGGAMRVNGTLYYVVKDHLGSASVVTDSSGNVVGEQRYYPFGETRLSTGTLYTDQLFTGQREMAGLGIYHYGARFYSPKLGRFLSADSIVPNPFNPQDFNRFSYVRNNPVRYVDPTGHICVQNGGGVDNEFGIPGNCNGGEKANYKNPFPGGVPAAKKLGKPKSNDNGGGQPTVTNPNAGDNNGSLVPIIPEGAGCSANECLGPQLISTNTEEIDAFEAFWQDVGEATGFLANELAIVSMAPPAVIVFFENPLVQFAVIPIDTALSVVLDAPGTREGDQIITEAFVVGEETITCYGQTFFTNTIVVTTIYDSEGNLVQSETRRNTGYCYQR